MPQENESYLDGAEAGQEWAVTASPTALNSLLVFYRNFTISGQYDQFFEAINAADTAGDGIASALSASSIAYWKNLLGDEDSPLAGNVEFFRGWVEGALSVASDAWDAIVLARTELAMAAARALESAKAPAGAKDEPGPDDLAKIAEAQKELNNCQASAMNARRSSASFRAISVEARARIDKRLSKGG